MKQYLNLPNQLTILRLLLVPLIAATMSIPFAYHMDVSLALFLIASATDTLDGYFARSRNLVTELGKFLDPLADKLLIITVLVIFVLQGQLPLWIVMIIITREFLITGLRSVAASQGVVIAASSWGKSKTFSQTCMIVLIMVHPSFPHIYAITVITVISIVVATVATILSGLDYIWRYRKFVL